MEITQKKIKELLDHLIQCFDHMSSFDGGVGGGGGSMFPCSQQFSLCSRVPLKYFFDFGALCSLNYNVCSRVPGFISLCSHVPKTLMAMFPGSLKPLGELIFSDEVSD